MSEKCLIDKTYVLQRIEEIKVVAENRNWSLAVAFDALSKDISNNAHDVEVINVGDLATKSFVKAEIANLLKRR